MTLTPRQPHWVNSGQMLQVQSWGLTCVILLQVCPEVLQVWYLGMLEVWYPGMLQVWYPGMLEEWYLEMLQV